MSTVHQRSVESLHSQSAVSIKRGNDYPVQLMLVESLRALRKRYYLPAKDTLPPNTTSVVPSPYAQVASHAPNTWIQEKADQAMYTWTKKHRQSPSSPRYDLP
jgi:hypothetical protein